MNSVDLIVIVILGLSAAIAFVRGFVREALSIAGWFGAVMITLWGFPLLRPLMRALISKTWAADAIAMAILFLVSAAIFAIISHRLSKAVHKTSLNAMDRGLGFGFGLLRGAVIVSLMWLVMTWLWTDDQQPPFMKEARTKPLMEKGAVILAALAPKDLLQPAEEKQKELDAKANANAEKLKEQTGEKPATPTAPAQPQQAAPAQPATTTVQTQPAPAAAPQQPAPAPGPAEEGYDDKSRNDMNRLFDTTE